MSLGSIYSKTVPVLPSFIFPFHLLPSPVNPTAFSFCFFPGFLAIFIFLTSNNKYDRRADMLQIGGQQFTVDLTIVFVFTTKITPIFH